MKTKINIKRLTIKLLILLPVLLFLNVIYAGIFIPLPYRSLAPFRGKVTDTDTKNPIPGAVVLAIYSMSVPSVAGEMSFIVDGHETATDENGEFKLPRKRRWFVLRRGYPEACLEIFKPGYGSLLHKRSTAVGENKSWPPPGKFVLYELPKLTNLEERRENVEYMRRYNEIPYAQKKIYWDKVNEELKNVMLPLNTR